jgi:hypothetical protein
MDSWGVSLTQKQKDDLIKEQQQIQNLLTSMSKQEDVSSPK